MDKQKRMDFLERISTPEELQKIEMSEEVLKTCLDMYDEAYIDSVKVYPFNTKRFVVSKEDVPKLPPTWTETLNSLSLDETLMNPVYVEVDEKGVLLVE